jgi:cytochrome c556
VPSVPASRAAAAMGFDELATTGISIMALKLTSAAAVVLVVGFATAALGAEDPIKLRQSTMKAIGGAFYPLVKIVLGKAPFDATVVKAALETVATKGKAIDIASYFPVGSGEGDTQAKATIWSDPDGFKAALAKFQAVAAEEAKAEPKSVDELKPVIAAIDAACSACHETYREKK